MPKKKVKNYDDTLIGAYIRQIENPDSIGWNPITRTWTAPALPGYDKRNRGMGIDILNNAAAKALTENRPDKYLTEEEERQLRNDYIDYSSGVLGRYHQVMPTVGEISPRKEAEAIGLIYRGDGPKIKNENTLLGKAYRSDNEEDFHKAVTDYYHSMGLYERAKNNDLFWQSHPSKSFFSTLTDKISTINNKYSSPAGGGVRANGGFLSPKDSWDSLSLQEKAKMIEVAVRNGIYNLQEIRQKYNEFAKGGEIHIKPENRGKFTALKKRTGHSATWFKEHGTPAQRKMATFALNARKWKHSYGGNLFEPFKLEL